MADPGSSLVLSMTQRGPEPAIPGPTRHPGRPEVAHDG